MRHSQFTTFVALALCLLGLSLPAIAGNTPECRLLLVEMKFSNAKDQSQKDLIACPGSLLEVTGTEGQDKLRVKFKEIKKEMPAINVGASLVALNTSEPEFVKYNVVYLVTMDEMGKEGESYRVRLPDGSPKGWTFGVLAVPFKLQKDGTLTAGSTLGPYLGWRNDWKGAPVTLLFSAGLAVVPVQDVNATTVSNKMGYSVATGLIFEPLPRAQVGLLVGVDHLGGATGKLYPYEDKVWISFSIGFSFTK